MAEATAFPVAVKATTPRDSCRLLALNRKEGNHFHFNFRDILNFFREGDCLVLNESAVFPARIRFYADGKEGEMLLGNLPHNDNPVVSAKIDGKTLKRLKQANGKVEFAKGGKGILEVLNFDQATRAFKIRILLDIKDAAISMMKNTLNKLVCRLGEVPLPPYILKARQRLGLNPIAQEDPDDYQTVYAQKPGSMACPTAGLHWTRQLLGRLEHHGVTIVKVALDIGFASLTTISGNGSSAQAPATLPEEKYTLSKQTADKINSTRSMGGRIFACGTSAVRTLETMSYPNGHLDHGSGKTSLFIKPGYTFRCVDAMITNFHLPESTNFLMTQAFVGEKYDLYDIYNNAKEAGYSFFSLGDAMVIYGNQS
ncbi:S-adenosylmethionine:tRNA ribosyltransferase-isomerase [Elusimicrobiota bacterium]